MPAFMIHLRYERLNNYCADKKFNLTEILEDEIFVTPLLKLT